MTNDDEERVSHLAKLFDNALPAGTRGMLVAYNESGATLEASIFCRESKGELLRILTAMVNATRGDSAAGTPARVFAPLGGDHRSLVSSVGIDKVESHEYVRIWNRGDLAGELVLREGDGEQIATLMGLVEQEEKSSA